MQINGSIIVEQNAISKQFQKLEPRNDDWNRKYNFMDDDSVGFLIEFKNGLAYFGWNFPGNVTRFYHCEQPVFEKRFKLLQDSVSYQLNAGEKINYLRYPTQH